MHDERRKERKKEEGKRKEREEETKTYWPLESLGKREQRWNGMGSTTHIFGHPIDIM
jgi:hypothetical protein